MYYTWTKPANVTSIGVVHAILSSWISFHLAFKGLHYNNLINDKIMMRSYYIHGLALQLMLDLFN